jgi:hypothetical protein
MGEVIEPGESVTSAQGDLKKREKDEEGLRNIPLLWVPEPIV